MKAKYGQDWRQGAVDHLGDRQHGHTGDDPREWDVHGWLIGLTIRDYTWVVPFLIDDSETIIQKTAFPSRKYHRRVGKDAK